MKFWGFLAFFSKFLNQQRLPQRLADVDESELATSASRWHYRLAPAPLSPRSRPPSRPLPPRQRAASLSPPSRPLSPRQRGRRPGGIARSRRATAPAPAAGLPPLSRLPLAPTRAIAPALTPALAPALSKQHHVACRTYSGRCVPDTCSFPRGTVQTPN
jgi:hypothetical protein